MDSVQHCKPDSLHFLEDSSAHKDLDLSAAAAAAVAAAVGRLSAHRVPPCCRPKMADADSRSVAQDGYPLTTAISAVTVAVEGVAFHFGS